MTANNTPKVLLDVFRHGEANNSGFRVPGSWSIARCSAAVEESKLGQEGVKVDKNRVPGQPTSNFGRTAVLN